MMMMTEAAVAVAEPVVDNDDDDNSVNSSVEALCELLGLESIQALAVEEDENDAEAPVASSISLDSLLSTRSEDFLRNHVQGLRPVYERDSVITFPEALRIPPALMRRLTNELVYRSDDRSALFASDKTYETITLYNSSTNTTRHERVLTRFENFVNHHAEWYQLTRYLGQCLSLAMDRPYVLFKEKLNLKPPGGSGFGPHVDAPSLQVALKSNEGGNPPTTFITVMVAIDAATRQNGCLRVIKGSFDQGSHPTVPPSRDDDNPDAGGRAGAIPSEVANELEFEDLTCPGGTIVAFDGWVPHRSGPNRSPFPRRAVFFTYNPADQGDWHDEYYAQMDELRNEWRRRVGLATRDEQKELEALQTIPRI